MKILKITSILIAMICFNSCSTNIKTYSDKSPKFDMRRYFDGELEAWGILKNRSGKVTRSFTVKMTGKWQGNEGTLEEHFVFDDGQKDHRIWKIKMIDDNNFTASAGDVVGTASGQQYGNAMKMKYVLTVPVDGKKYDIKIEDWMYLIDEKSLINSSELRKFGFKVGSLTIGFKKR